MRARVIAVAAALAVAGSAAIGAFGQVASQSALPPGTVLDPPRTTQPRQMLRSEIAGGRQSFLVELGNTAFSAPSILGPAAQAAGLSCNTCHINGEANPRFFIPGMSSRPGNIDPTGPHFNPVADNFVLDPVDIPSLRGIRFTAPYGRDGRTASLREFTRNVIVGEFAGAEPSPLILDALVAYMNELEFIPNPQLRPDGALAAPANAAARRGEALFRRSFAGMGGQSCAACHIPTAAFVDGRATTSVRTACSTRRPCSTPTRPRPISTTGATRPTAMSSRISIASSASSSPRATAPTSSPISRPWATPRKASRT